MEAERELSYFEAIFEAEQQEMDRDERVILIGEDIHLYSGSGLLQVDAKRLRKRPISTRPSHGRRAVRARKPSAPP